MAKVGIIGAGISGLSAAYYLNRALPMAKIKIFEKRHKVGGWIDTVNQNFEKGPHSIRATNKRVSDLFQIIEQIGLSDDIVFSTLTSTSAQNRFICVGDKLHLIPRGLTSLFATYSPLTSPLMKHMMKDFLSTNNHVDATVDDFFRTRFGDEFSDYMISSLCRGIFGASSTELSMEAAFPDICKATISGGGSIIRGLLRGSFYSKIETVNSSLWRRSLAEKWAAFTFKEGLDQLPRALRSYLVDKCGVECSLNTSVEKMELSEDKIKLNLKNDESEDFDYVFSSIYLSDLTDLVGNDEFAEMLKSVKTIDMAVVDVGLENVRLAYDGFGYLVPECESDELYGVTFNSRIFPPQRLYHQKHGSEQLSFLYNGKLLNDQDFEQKLADKTLMYLRKHLNIKTQPAWMTFDDKRNCLPLYSIGHVKRIQDITDHIKRKKWPLTLVGGSLNYVDVPGIVHHVHKVVSDLTILTNK